VEGVKWFKAYSNICRVSSETFM